MDTHLRPTCALRRFLARFVLDRACVDNVLKGRDLLLQGVRICCLQSAAQPTTHGSSGAGQGSGGERSSAFRGRDRLPFYQSPLHDGGDFSGCPGLSIDENVDRLSGHLIVR